MSLVAGGLQSNGSATGANDPAAGWTSNGTTTTTAQDVSIGSGNVTSTKTTASLTIISSTDAATASATVGAVEIRPATVLGANDAVFRVTNSAGTAGLMVDQEGDVFSGKDLRVGGSGDFYAGGASILFSVAGANGNMTAGGAVALTSFTDDSATPGARTVNKCRGKNAVAAGATTVVITNSFCTATSQVLCTLESVDATALYLRAVVPSGTGFTVTLGPAAATAAVVFSWIVIN